MGNYTTRLSIIIPAYNEAERISPTLTEYLEYFSAGDYHNRVEIIVVLNGCKDSTESIVQSFLPLYNNLQLLVFPDAIGKGGAIKKGFDCAKGEYIGYTDADNSTSPGEFEKIFRAIEGNSEYDCAIGSRSLKESVVEDKNWKRNVMSRGFNTGVNILFGLGVKDTQCGAKIFTTDIIHKIYDDITIANMAFDINLLVDTKRKGGAILEIPIEWHDKDGSSITSPVGTSVAMALSVVRLRLLYSPFRFLYPILEPVGGFLLTILGQKRFEKKI
jgi:glycosyltransferase involved in cell wall biosynthesis